MATSDPFERHGIDHLSPSSLRLFREAPAVWIGKYLMRVEDLGGPGAWRGKAVEAGVDRLLFGFDKTDAEVAMLNAWDHEAQGVVDDAALKEHGALLDFLRQAWLAFHDQPIPLQRQAKVSLEIPGISVPLIGYADWVWPAMGTDLKTTWRMPSTPDPIHIEQISVYSLHFGVPFTLTYVTPKKWTRYEINQSQAAEAWDRVIEAAHAVRSFLAKVDGAHDALSMFAPDYTSFYFSPAMVEAVRSAKAVRVLTR
jgi:hypothetical protein